MRTALGLTILVLVAIIVLQWQCDKPTTVITEPSTRVRDSLKQVQTDLSLYKKLHVYDSSEKVVLKKERDSLQASQTRLTNLEKGKVKIINDLIDQIQTNAIESPECDSLAKEVKSGIDLVQLWQSNAYLIDSNSRKEIAAKDKSLSTLDSLYGELDKTFFAYQIEAQRREDSIMKQAVSIPQYGRVSIGASSGVTYYNGSAKPYVGIGLNYRIIQFKKHKK